MRDTGFKGWSSSALRRLFNEHRGDYAILKRLNDVLKERNSDSDNDLHIEVAMAIRVAQKHENVRAATHHQDVLGIILARHGQIADGRPLFQYRITEAEYKALRDCSSSDNLRLIRHFEKGGSGSSGLEFKRPAVGAASGGLRWWPA